MKGASSFRRRLALRFGLTVMVLTIAVSITGYVALHNLLHQQLDRILQELAAIEAAAQAGSPDGTVQFHDEVFLSGGPGEDAILNRYAQVWTLEGEPVLRTTNLDGRDLVLPEAVRVSVVETGEPTLFSTRWQGARYRSVLYPLGLVGHQHRIHLLQVAASTAQIETVLSRFARLLLLLVLGGTVVAYGLGSWLASHALQPVMEIIDQAESIDASARRHRIAARTESRELGRLVSVLNSMLERIDRGVDNQRRFLAEAGHEIRTPLTVLRGDLEVALRRRRSPEEYEGVLRRALDDLREVSSLADDLITLARSDGGALVPEFTEVPLHQLLDKVAGKYRGTARSAGVELTTRIDPPDLNAWGDPALLERAVGNLVDNAIKYGGSGGRVRLTATEGEPGRVRVSVTDRGPGIPRDERSRVLERFYRGKAGRRAVRGSGLGLAIVRALAAAHGGWLELDDPAGGGTRFTVILDAFDGDRVTPDRDPLDIAPAAEGTGVRLRANFLKKS